METVFRIVLGLVITGIGAWAFIAIFAPKFRLPWKGTNVTAGTFTHMGFSMAFMSGGITAVFHDPEKTVHPLVAMILIAGFAFVAIGNFVDFRRPTDD